MKRIVFLILLALATGCQTVSNKEAAGQKRITEEDIKKTLESLKGQGVDHEKPLLYSYFFKDKNPDPLRKLGEELKKDKLNMVAVYQDDDGINWLQMEHTRIHTIKSLDSLNQHLYKMAAEYDVEAYDGFEIGNPEKENPADHLPTPEEDDEE